MEIDEEILKKNKDAYQQIAPIYARNNPPNHTSIHWKYLRDRFHSSLQSALNDQERATLPIADIGCGPGRDALWFAQMGYQVLAIDLSPAMLAEAHNYLDPQPEASQIKILTMDMHQLALPDSSCAALWLSASFLHIPKKENASVIRELARVLTTNGLLMLVVKERRINEIDEEYAVHYETGDQRFFAYYDGSELWELARENGFQPLELLAQPDARPNRKHRWLALIARKQTPDQV